MDASQLTQPENCASPGSPSDLLERAAGFARQADSENTVRTYRAGWEHFKGWCDFRRTDPLPARPETVALYLTDMAEHYSVSTLQSRLSAINRIHKESGHEAPGLDARVRRILRGIRRAKGAFIKQASPIMAGELRSMLSSLPDTLLGCRDRALLLLAFCGAFRRSEIAVLNVQDIRQERDGLRVLLRRSKTDQEGQGLEKGITYQSDSLVCPVRAVLAWIEQAGLSEGPLFRPVSRHGRIANRRLSDRAVDLIVKRTCKAAGLTGSSFSAHSLRSGLATQASADGCPERLIAKQGGWRSLLTLRRYIRHGSLFRENVGTFLRLAG